MPLTEETAATDSKSSIKNAPTTVELLRPLGKPVRLRLGLVAITLATGVAKFTLPLMIPWLTGNIIDHLLNPQALAQQTTSALTDELLMYAGIGVAVIVAHAIATNIRSRAGAALSAFIQHYLRRKLFAHLQRLSLNFFKNITPGR